MRRTEADKAFNQRQKAVLEIMVLPVSDHIGVQLSHTALGKNDEGGFPKVTCELNGSYFGAQCGSMQVIARR